jgi:plastocyanin
MKRLALLVVAAGAVARADTLAGTIEDPGLRRKIQLVYVENVAGNYAPSPAPAVMNQVGNKYLPHVLPVVAGTTISFQSQDPELHNVNARAGKQTLFNNAVLPRQHFERKFDQPGVVHLSCNVHREMSADIVVLQNPYFARPDAKGAFAIEGVPAGSYTLRVFGDELSAEQKAKKFTVTVGGGAQPLKIASNP